MRRFLSGFLGFSAIFLLMIFVAHWVFAKPAARPIGLTDYELELESKESEESEESKDPKIEIKHPHVDATTPTAKDLLRKNWNLQGLPIKAEDLEPFFETSQPESILVLTPEGQKRVYPLHRESGALQSDQTLYITSPRLREQIARERSEADPKGHRQGSTGLFPNSPDQTRADKKEHIQQKSRLPEHAFEIVSFFPGLTDRGTPIIPVINDWLGSLQGPDYSMEDYDRNNRSLMLDHLSKVFSLGHGGELLIRLTGNGVLLSEEGPDLFIFHTAFRMGQSDFYWNKFGKIGFSDHPDPSSFRWFECDPPTGKLKGCVGLMPTVEGGDSFRLEEIGLKSARYIRIKDLGNNQNIKNKFNFPTEGVSIDALRLDHAFQLD